MTVPVQVPVPVTPTPATPSVNVKRAVAIGMMPGLPNNNIFNRMRMYDGKVDSILLYQTVQYLSWSYVKSNLDAGLKVQLVLEFHDSYPNLWDIANGKYDGKLTEIFNNIRADGRPITVRPMHEFNGDWYSWGALAGGSNSFDAFKAAFRHVSGVIRRLGGPNVTIQISYNSLNAKSDKTSFVQQYPGDEFLDEICVSAYQFCGRSQWHTTVQSIGEIMGVWYSEMSKATTKPMCIAEMSSTNAKCGGKAGWMTQTWDALAVQYTRIKTINWFFQNNFSLLEDLDLNSAEEITAWSDGMKAFKMKTGYGQADANDVTAVTAAQEIEALKAKEQYDTELKERGLHVSIDGSKQEGF
jgi:hypothetical protein